MRNAILSLLLLVICTTAQAQQRPKIDENILQRVSAAQFYISNFYVDSLSADKVADNAIEGMLKQLDPHSTYIRAKDVERSNENLNGSFEGIGVQFNMVDDTLVVIQPVSGGPSEKRGIIAGDRIVQVNDTAIAGVKMSREEIMRRLRGPKDTKVKLGIVRQGVKGINNFIVTRDKIPVYTLDAHFLIDPTTAYIRISSFGATTHEEFMKAFNEMREKGARDLVLDLQGNGGGYLQAAVQLANEFLSASDLIVYTEGRTVRRQEYRANGEGSMQKGRIVVLVDSYTASAAEIVSGALQDHDRAIIVGRRTFGKGLVQRPFELPDHSVIRLTTAHYFTPTGRCIQKPYKMGERKEYDDDITTRLNSGELTNVDSIHFADSLRYETTRKHRIVYGGGGIMPDVYVPLDTTQYTFLHRQMSAKGIIINATLRYIDRNRKALRKQYPDFESYNANFSVPQSLIDQTLEEAAKVKIQYTDSLLQATLPYLRSQLKALIARDLWEMNEYFQIINAENNIFNAGLKALKEEE